MLVAFFTFCLCFYVWFILDSGWRFAWKRPSPSSRWHPAVSVLIPARNEEAGLAACLKSVLQQRYPAHRLEVIVVNDHSTDRTKEIATRMSSRYPNLRVIDLEAGTTHAYKKAAITAGVKVAMGEIILQTDADCVVEPGWVQAMVDPFTPDTALVSGPVALTWRKGHWLEAFQALESMGLVAIGAGSLLAGRPNMCNGANLAYRREVFEEVGGFQGVDAIASGDDELLLQKVHGLDNWRMDFVKNREAIVRTPAMPGWRELKAQRLRWVSKARYYPNRWVNVAQGLSYLAFLGIPVTAVLAFFHPQYWSHLGIFVLGKLLADTFILYQAARFFHNLPLLKYLLPLQPLYLLYVLWIGVAGNLVSTYTWKDRQVK